MKVKIEMYFLKLKVNYNSWRPPVIDYTFDKKCTWGRVIKFCWSVLIKNFELFDPDPSPLFFWEQPLLSRKLLCPKNGQNGKNSFFGRMSDLKRKRRRPDCSISRALRWDKILALDLYHRKCLFALSLTIYVQQWNVIISSYKTIIYPCSTRKNVYFSA